MWLKSLTNLIITHLSHIHFTNIIIWTVYWYNWQWWSVILLILNVIQELFSIVLCNCCSIILRFYFILSYWIPVPIFAVHLNWLNNHWLISSYPMQTPSRCEVTTRHHNKNIKPNILNDMHQKVNLWTLFIFPHFIHIDGGGLDLK